MEAAPTPVVDLLGPSSPAVDDIYAPPTCEPGRVVDLSGASGLAGGGRDGRALGPRILASSSGFASSGGGGLAALSFSSGGATGGSVTAFGAGPRGPTSIEGGAPSGLAALPAQLLHQLATRPVTDIIQENGRFLVNVPRYMVRAYTSVAQRYLQPWNKFARIHPARVFERMRAASQRGEIQIHLQQNVLANARAFCPNYVFIFVATLFMFICTNPVLLAMLGAVGGGWAHAMHSEDFRSRPWMLQIGGVHVPLGSNAKMAAMSLPTLLVLHFFMGPVLWSAALYSGGISIAHAALRDREEDRDSEDGGGVSSSGYSGRSIQDMA